MKSNHRIALTGVLFFCVSTLLLYLLLMSRTFVQIKNFYISTQLFNWLNLFIDKPVAASVLGRLLLFIWTIFCLMLWNKYIDHSIIIKNIFLKPINRKFKYFAIGFFTQASIAITALCMTLALGNTIIIWNQQNLISIIYYFIFSGIIIGFNVFAEELIFRGYILQKFFLIFNNNTACLISTLFFMISHPFHALGLYGIIMQSGLFGIAFAYIAFYYNSIYITCGIHLANNLIVRAIFSPKLFYISSESSSFNFMRIYEIIWISTFVIFFIYHRLWKNPRLKLSE